MDVTDRERRLFDRYAEEILASLPEALQQRLEEVFVNIDDAPPRRDLRKLRVRRPDHLRGLYHGVPLTRRGVHDTGRLPDTITLYRLGILESVRGANGRIDEPALREQIRITLLHEIGHLFGMDEDDLAGYGYA